MLTRIQATFAGARARDTLGRSRQGTVLSSHATGLYCRCDTGQVLLLHNDAFGVIPFGLGCPAPGGPTGWKNLEPGSGIRNDPQTGVLRIGQVLLSYAEAEERLPVFPWEHETPNPVRLRRGFAHAKDRLAGPRTRSVAAFFSGPETGDSQDAGEGNEWETAVHGPLRALLDYCGHSGGMAPETDPYGLVKALVGLGPGLTPLGDDVLCGLLAASHSLAQAFPTHPLARLKRDISRAILGNLEGATTSQSVAFLQSAAAGERFAMLDGLLGAVYGDSPEELDRALSVVLDVGHTSGSGLVLGTLCAVKAATSTV